MIDRLTHTQLQVGRNVRRLRLALGLTEEVSAASAGLGTKHMQVIEAGLKNVSLRSLVRLSKAFNTFPYVLLLPTKTTGKARYGATAFAAVIRPIGGGIRFVGLNVGPGEVVPKRVVYEQLVGDKPWRVVGATASSVLLLSF